MSAELRAVSGTHWTPVAVALQVAQWLEAMGVRTVADLGSGAGKFCVVTALASRCDFVGIEHRSRFVDAASALARTFELKDRVSFRHASLSAESIPRAEAYYLFNPFGENLFGPEAQLGNDVELSTQRYERDVAMVEAFLEKAPVGTIFIEYNGFGGWTPRSFAQMFVDHTHTDVLRLTRKRSDTPATHGVPGALDDGSTALEAKSTSRPPRSRATRPRS